MKKFLVWSIASLQPCVWRTCKTFPTLLLLVTRFAHNTPDSLFSALIWSAMGNCLIHFWSGQMTFCPALCGFGRRSSGRIQPVSLMLLTRHMTYWDPVYWTNRTAVRKNVRAGVLIDNSFWLCRHNDINHGEAVGSGLKPDLPEGTAACHLDGRAARCSSSELRKGQRIWLLLSVQVTSSLTWDTWGLAELRRCQRSGQHAIQLMARRSLKTGTDEALLRCRHTVIRCHCLK